MFFTTARPHYNNIAFTPLRSPCKCIHLSLFNTKWSTPSFERFPFFVRLRSSVAIRVVVHPFSSYPHLHSPRQPASSGLLVHWTRHWLRPLMSDCFAQREISVVVARRGFQRVDPLSSFQRSKDFFSGFCPKLSRYFALSVLSLFDEAFQPFALIRTVKQHSSYAHEEERQ